MSVEEIIRLASLGVSLLISLAGLIAAIIKAIKNKKWDSLKSAVFDFLMAEGSITDENSDAKKQDVLQWAENFCKEQNIDFDAEKVASVIEKLLTLSKRVSPGDQAAPTTANKISSAETDKDVEA